MIFNSISLTLLSLSVSNSFVPIRQIGVTTGNPTAANYFNSRFSYSTSKVLWVVTDDDDQAGEDLSEEPILQEDKMNVLYKKWEEEFLAEGPLEEIDTEGDKKPGPKRGKKKKEEEDYDLSDDLEEKPKDFLAEDYKFVLF